MDIKIIIMFVMVLFLTGFFHNKFKALIQIVSDVIDDNTKVKESIDVITKKQELVNNVILTLNNNFAHICAEQDVIKTIITKLKKRKRKKNTNVICGKDMKTNESEINNIINSSTSSDTDDNISEIIADIENNNNEIIEKKKVEVEEQSDEQEVVNESEVIEEEPEVVEEETEVVEEEPEVVEEEPEVVEEEQEVVEEEQEVVEEDPEVVAEVKNNREVTIENITKPPKKKRGRKKKINN